MDVEAIQAVLPVDGPKQQLALANQAMAAAHQAQLEQRFELGLQRAAEVSAQTFQSLEESTRTSRDAGYSDAFHVAETTEVEMRPSFGGDKMGEAFQGYIESFQSRTREYPKEISALIHDRKEATDVPANAVTADGFSGQAEPQETKLQPEDALVLMEKGLWFRTETELVSTVSRNATRTINDLMKGQ